MTAPVKVALWVGLGLFLLGVLELMRGPTDTGPDLLPRLDDATFASTLQTATVPVLEERTRRRARARNSSSVSSRWRSTR